MQKYKFHIDHESRKVICITKYHGKTIRGIAKCSENDVWDVEKGKKLSFQRCYSNFLTQQLQYLSSCESRAESEYQRAKRERDKIVEIQHRVAEEYLHCVHRLMLLERDY